MLMSYNPLKIIHTSCFALALIAFGAASLHPRISYAGTVAIASPSKETDEKPDAADAPEDEKGDTAADNESSEGEKTPSLGNYLSGRFAESLGDTDNGIHFLRESLKRDPDNKETLASLYRMLMLSGQVEEALPVARKIAGSKVVEEGSEFSPEMLLAIDEAKQGQYEAADKRIGAIAKTGINGFLLPLFQAWLKLGENAVKTPVEAKDIVPGAKVILPHVYLNAAFINDIAGFDDQALKQYEASVKDPRVEPFRAVEALANYYSRKGMKEKREHLVSDYVAAHGESFLASELLSEPEGVSPKPLVNNATEGLAELFYTVANIFHGIRAPADEVATLRLALYLRPDFPAAQFLLAGTYELAQDYREAIVAYKAINKDSPYYLRGRIRSTYDENEMGNKEKALSELDAMAAQMPGDVDALLAKGDILRGQDQYKEAIEAYSAALARVKELHKEHWIIFFSRGACYESIKQWDKAELDMKKALELSPGEPDVLNFLGYSWLTMNHNVAEARKMIETAYDARPEDAHIIDSMGYAFYIAGDFPSAMEYFQQALERTPDDPTVNSHLGDTYWQMNRKTEARYQWQRALANNTDGDMEKELHAKLADGIPPIAPLSKAGEDKKPSAPSAEE